MAELGTDILKNGVTTITNPNEPGGVYTDEKDRTLIDELTLQLKPLEGAMRKALNRVGMNAGSMSYENVIVAFYNNFALEPGQKPFPITYLSEHPGTQVKISELEGQDPDNYAQIITKVISAAPKIVTGVKKVSANVRNKAKAKKAQKIADAGGYNTLSGFQKSLIADPNLTNSAPLTKTEQALAADVDKVVTDLEKKESGESPVSNDKMKKIIIIAVVVVGVVLLAWFFLKKK